MSSQSEPVNHSSHPHPLHRTNIHNSGLRHDCNACRQQINGFSYRMVGYNHWLYRCESCGFDAHLGCIHTPNIQKTHMQSYQSTPMANLTYQATGGTQQFPTGHVRPGGGSGRGNNNVMNQATQGLINGSTQSVGMYGVQALLGVGAFAGTTNNWDGGSNDDGGNGGDGGDWGDDDGSSND